MNVKAYRPQDKTLKRLIEYLESIGLSVYGQNVDLNDGELYPALRDFGPDDVVHYRKLDEEDGFWCNDEE